MAPEFRQHLQPLRAKALDLQTKQNRQWLHSRTQLTTKRLGSHAGQSSQGDFVCVTSCVMEHSLHREACDDTLGKLAYCPRNAISDAGNTNVAIAKWMFECQCML